MAQVVITPLPDWSLSSSLCIKVDSKGLREPELKKGFIGTERQQQTY
jgi:hypothetical protein